MIVYTPFRYPGGKTKLYNKVKHILKKNNALNSTFIEPFAGGAGLAIKLLLNGDVKRIILNESDYSIFCFWEMVLYDCERLCKLIEEIEVTPKNWIIQKDIYNSTDIIAYSTKALAAIFLNRTNINGILKGGMIGGKGQKGKYKINSRFNKETLIKKIKTINKFKDNIEIHNHDGSFFINNVLQYYWNAFIFIDPPYVDKGPKLYKKYYDDSGHVELARVTQNAWQKWICTYDINPLVEELYKDYRKDYLKNECIIYGKGVKR